MWVGMATDSASMKKDAACSLCGCVLSLGVCVGAAAVGADERIWWLDALVALLVSTGLLLYGSGVLFKNARQGNITVQPSDPDDVAEELDATWMQTGGNGDPMKRAFDAPSTKGTTMHIPPLDAPTTDAMATVDANVNGKGRRSKIVL